MTAEGITGQPTSNPRDTLELPLVTLVGKDRFRHVIQTPPERFADSQLVPRRTRAAGIDSKGLVVAVQPSLFEQVEVARESSLAVPSETAYPITTPDTVTAIESVYTPPEPEALEEETGIRQTLELPVWSIYWHARGHRNKLHALWEGTKSFLQYQWEDAKVAYQEVIHPFVAGTLRAVFDMMGLKQSDPEEAPQQFMRFDDNGPYSLTISDNDFPGVNTSDMRE